MGIKLIIMDRIFCFVRAVLLLLLLLILWLLLLFLLLAAATCRLLSLLLPLLQPPSPPTFFGADEDNSAVAATLSMFVSLLTVCGLDDETIVDDDVEAAPFVQLAVSLSGALLLMLPLAVSSPSCGCCCCCCCCCWEADGENRETLPPALSTPVGGVTDDIARLCVVT